MIGRIVGQAVLFGWGDERAVVLRGCVIIIIKDNILFITYLNCS